MTRDLEEEGVEGESVVASGTSSRQCKQCHPTHVKTVGGENGGKK